MNVLVITGASGGIGAATARLFLQQDWRVVNLSRRHPSIDDVVHIPCDLAEPGFITTIKDALTMQVPAGSRICLLHNASMLENDACGGLDDAAFRRIVQVNLLAPNALNNLLVPHMGAGSSLLYVGSTLSEKAVANSFSYVTTKHGLLGMMRATCQDLAGRGIHTALLCPGFTDTQMLRTHVGNDGDVLNAIAGMSAFNRLVEPQEIAETVWFAATHPVINGAVIHANLGQIER